MQKASVLSMAFLLPIILIVGASAGRCGDNGDEADGDAPVKGAPDVEALITLKVTDFETARQSVLDVATKLGAQLKEAGIEVNTKGRKHGFLRFRVESKELPETLRAVRQTGKVESEQVATTDHVSAYQETEKRVAPLREHEKRLAGLLENPKRLRGSDILFIQDRLHRSGLEEATLLQTRADLERGMRDSTVEVKLFEPGSVATVSTSRINLRKWFSVSRQLALAQWDRRLAKAATASAYAAVFAPFWAPLTLLILLFGWWLIRRLARWLRNAALRRTAVAMSLWISRLLARGSARLTRIAPRRRPPTIGSTPAE